MSSENTNITLTVEAWADIVIKEWVKKADALGIKGTGALLASFYNTVITAAAGDPRKVIFAFAWYGKMVDYGIGNGVSLLDRDMMISGGMTKRRPKPWFTDTFYKQVETLRHLLEEKYANLAERLIIESLNEKY